MAADICGQSDADEMNYQFLNDNTYCNNDNKLYFKIMSLKNRCVCNRTTQFRWKKYEFLSFMFLFLTFSHTRSASALRTDFNSWGSDSSETDPRYSTENASNYETCLKGEYLKGYTLAEGREAGVYTNLGTADNFQDCIELCCDDDSCKVALMLTSPRTHSKNCFKIECFEPEGDSCKPKSARRSKYHPYLFKRGMHEHRPPKVATSENHSLVDKSNLVSDQDLPSLIREKRKRGSKSNGANHTNYLLSDQDLPSLIREKRKRGSKSDHVNHTKENNVCRKYTGNVCADSLDARKFYYYLSNNETTLEHRLVKPIAQISNKLSGGCKIYALQAICYRFFPQCADPTYPKPMKICKQECEELTYGECAVEFKETNMLKYLKHIIPECGSKEEENEDSKAGCITLSTENPDNKVLHDDASFVPTTLSPHHENSTSNIVTTSSAEQEGSVSVSHRHTTPHSSVLLSPSLPNKLAHNTSTNMSSNIMYLRSNNSNLQTDFRAVANNTKNESSPTIVDLPDELEAKETDFEELEVSSTTATPIVSVKDSKDDIRVSAGDNTELVLPSSEVSLYASTWPKENSDNKYTYKWTQVSAPEDGHGYIEGATTKNVKLSKLDVPGVYSFQLDVSSVDKKHGVGYVNITVKNKAHMNHPPRAEVYPNDQTITLPTNTVVLDASKSTDDKKIISFKWEELKGPIKEKTVFASATDKKILQLRNLIAGVYHFKLTVTDEEGETDTTEASVIVKEEQDYPPEANAGSDIIVRLPNNTAMLNGDKSTDDKGTLTYEWSKTPESPTCDMQGTDKSHLQLSRLTEGTYVFNLKVTDSSDHSSTASVKVIVLPEVNTKPIAIAGDDKELVFPDDSTTLDGSKSQDNSKIISYHWEQISGPSKSKMVSADTAKVYVSELKAGSYVMKLSVTDDKNLVGTDTVKIHVKKDHNEKPTANAGIDQTIYLPTRYCVIDGSQSSDDEYIETYLWVRAGSSPAAGDILNGSDHQAILKLSNLIKGKYIYDLTVTDNKGLSGKDTVTITVKEDPKHMGLVELYLDVDIGSFTQENKKQLTRQISVVMGVGKEYVHIEEMYSVGNVKGVKLLFYINDPIVSRILDGKYVADVLKNKVGHGGKIFEYKMQKVEPYICRSNCSGHGFCDATTKQCVCDTFWMPNVFKANFGEKDINCDWSVLYLSVAVFAVFLFFVGVSWTVCFCFARSRRSRRRARYKALRGTDPDGVSDEILLIPKRMKEKFSANSLTFTESDEDSEDDNTVFDKKRLVNGKARPNGKVKYRDHAM